MESREYIIYKRTSVSNTHARMTYVYFKYPCAHECFANEIQELRNRRLSSLSSNSTSRSSSSRCILQSSPLLLPSLLQQTCPEMSASMEPICWFITIVRGASSPCNGNHFLVYISPLYNCTVQRVSRSLRSLANYMCVYKKIAIERTRDLIYLKFVATNFFQ